MTAAIHFQPAAGARATFKAKRSGQWSVRTEWVGGTLNKTGSVLFKATRVGKDTALARIIGMVQQAPNCRSTSRSISTCGSTGPVVTSLPARWGCTGER